MSNIINHPCKTPIERIRELEELLNISIGANADLERSVSALSDDRDNLVAHCQRLSGEVEALARKAACKRHAACILFGLTPA